MKRFIGIFLILVAFPLLFYIQQGISRELSIAQAVQSTLSDAIQLEKPSYDLPVTMINQFGHPFTEIYVEWRTPLPLAEIPILAQDVFVESEDAGFFTHKGYDASAIVRAFIVNTQADDKKQGASTITQQLIRMQYLTTDKTYERKVTELLYAAKLEEMASKEEILEAYLNEIYFANRVYGIGSAASYYFNKPLQKLHPAEIAFLAAIPNNPAKYDPLLHFDNTKARQERLLDILSNKQIITHEENAQYKNHPIELSIKRKMNRFPAYSDYVLAEFEQLVADQEGFTTKIANAPTEAEKAVFRKEAQEKIAALYHTGITIETALNPVKQQQDEAGLNQLLYRNGVQAGAVVIDNEEREIVSIYGGKDYSAEQFNRAYQAVRQPGSALKPLLVYAPLFEDTPYHAGTIVNSGPICIESYCPENVGGFVYGNTTIQEAFRHSHNIAAVRLLQQVGIQQAFGHLEPFQFASLSQEDYGFPAALGGLHKGVTPLELAGAYTSFIDGTYRTPRAIRTVKDAKGNLLYEWPKDPVEVWSSNTTQTMRTLLKDVVLNGTGRGLPYTTNYTGIKTGTTNAYNDLWTVGLNDVYTTAVWLGLDQPASIRDVSNQKDHLHAMRILLTIPQ